MLNSLLNITKNGWQLSTYNFFSILNNLTDYYQLLMRLAWMSVVSPFKYLHVLPFSGFSKALLQWTMIALVIFSLNELFESNLLKDWTEIYLPTTVLIYHWSGFYSFCQWKQYNNNRLNKVYIHTYALILFHNRGWGWGLHTGAYLPNSI